MIYEIKRGNTVLYSGKIPGQRREAIMGVDVVNATFTLKYYIDFLKGDTMLVDGELFTCSKPSDFEQGGKWTYNLNFVSEGYKLADTEMLGLDENNVLNEYDCFFTGTADRVMDFIIANANKDNPGWVKGVVDVTETFDFDFTGDNCTNALVKLADRAKTEFWFEGKTLYLTKKGADSGLSFRQGKGKGLLKLIRKTLDNKPVTRLRVYGSKQNLPSTYPGLSKRLRMPNNQLYIQDQAKVDKYGLIPQTILFEDIFPKRIGTVTAVTNALTFTDTSIDFNINDHLFDKVPAKVKFITGQCAGYQFDIRENGYNHATKTITLNVNKDEKAMEVPSATGLKPAVGDQYILIDVIMPQVDITKAEIELKAKAEEKYLETVDPRVQFEAPTDRRYLREYDLFVKIGDFVNIASTEAGIDKDIRVISKTTNLQDKYDVTLELADTVSVANIVKQIIAQDAIQKAIKNNKLNDITRARNNWRTTAELSTMLDTLRAEMLLIMVDGGNYSTDILSTTTSALFTTTAGVIQHEEYIENGGDWNASASSHNLTGGAKFAYIKASKISKAATVVLSDTKIAVNDDPAFYYFPYGIISSVINGARFFTSTKGYTRITANQVQTGAMVSTDSQTGFDLDNSTIFGNIKFRSSAGGLKDVRDVDDANESISEYITAILPGELGDLQNQIDGAIESYFYEYDPTGANEPALSWNTPELKVRHGNDTFTNTSTGASWRWLFEDASWKWKVITDTATQQALLLAGKAQDTADSKRRNFVVQPFTPYDRGDTWTQGVGGELMRCVTTRLTGAFVLADWDKASKYTDDTYAAAQIALVNQEIADVAGFVDDLDTYVDGAFSDGVIQIAEAKAIEKYLNSLKTEIDDLDNKWLSIYNNPSLTGTPKSNLFNAKVIYNAAYVNLIDSINSAIADGKTAPTEKADVDAKFILYRAELAVLSTRFEEAINAIAQAKIDAVKIGGRNLLRNSNTINLMGGTVDTGVLYNGKPTMLFNIGQTYSGGLHQIKPNSVYTYSALIRFPYDYNSNSNVPLHFHVRNESQSSNGAYSHGNGDEAMVAGVWKVIHYTIYTDVNSFYFVPFLYTAGFPEGTFNVAWFKLEEGTKPSDWTPAPEDVSADIKNAQDTADKAAGKTDFLTTTVDGNIIATGTVLVGDAAGNNNGGITGVTDDGDQSVREWYGASYANRNIAPWRVLHNGKMYATDGEFSGKIIAGVGSVIGGVSIGADGKFYLMGDKVELKPDEYLRVKAGGIADFSGAVLTIPLSAPASPLDGNIWIS